MYRFFILACAIGCMLTAQARDRQNFDNGWRFVLADSAQMSKTDYHDTHWRALNLPHDWAVEGDFLCSNPSGAGGGALPGGIGWYRKTFNLQKKQGERYFIEFDGVYMNARVYINGKEVGYRPYGYSSFEYDITPYLIAGRNVVAVRVDNSDQPNSRWYSGCGIYRHVWFTKTADVHVKHWGVHVVANPDGRISVTADVESQGKAYKVRNQVFDAQGRAVGLKVRRPHLWSVDDPYIYKVRTQVLVGGKVVDEVWTNTGFRSFRFDAKTGFWLNGKNMKLNGVCEHHDFGCLGAVVNEDAMHRKLVRLKEMGVNAIRSSHNPPAPELLNMCDTMGLIVMDESFDMWRRRKTQNDYARFFDEWHERDLADLILRDRNHPSILMWSIGNEVLEQWSSADADTLTLEQANLILNAGHDASTLAKDGETSVNTLLADHLADIVRRYDTTRPITAGCNEPSPDNHLFKGKALDIVGFNYHHQWIKDVPKNFPGRPFIMTESVSALQTTGFYTMPSDSVIKAPKEWWLPYTDPSFKCSSYDNMHASWSSTHEETWDVVKHTPYVGGQFIWTGFDYIGEPTPYSYPARSSYFGIIDLAGQPKDVYYMYQSEWTNRPVLHLFPHWNWLDGEQIDMWCYYNQADEVELYINGKSHGVRRKADSHQYHVMWRVTFEPGEVKVVARKDGKEVRQQTIHTAGQPHHLQLSIDYQGKNTTFVKVEVVDENGNRCPWAENQVFFDTDATIIGVDNGNQTSLERFKDNKRKAFFGRCFVVLDGHGTLTAKSYGLPTATIKL
ncbi:MULTISPECIES: glycoside hydrolase family 2 TIM barrel-domain containing protein [unclassified Prevotella]|uniref:glycoside hydrolase family 2 TIM barrel-domain containing protein n=1 Tax=unclassified Prevotella TaxID=2638335 RepID=UPI000B9723EC|nr:MULTISPECIES: glycoside hydrolase family 2 TIM barrel-domain containing protein [unclassified Prevotella]OYP39610.1 glycoside hydrolase family 2 [Prevotella sp. P5-50]OYP46064.1 glycoside hydrolase family 2 [Prevotella sp. P4-119]